MKASEFLKEDDEQIIHKLVKKLTNASEAYYNTGSTIMSDADYDALESKLRSLDPDNPFFLGIGSASRGDKVKLPITMGSLDQVQEGDTVKWIRNEKLSNTDIVAADKLDGNSILLVYNDIGNLQIAFSRGNGIEGQDVTRQVKKMKSVPLTGVKNARFVVAEVIMRDGVFNKIQSGLEKQTGRLYKNPRNFVAGQMNKKVSADLFYQNVDVVAYGIRNSNLNKDQQYKVLEQNGFTIAGYKLFKGSELSDEILERYLVTRHSASPFALDGIVLDVNDATIANKMSGLKKSSSLNPASSKKFKVGQVDNVAVSRVVAVHWNVSKDGYLKPRVEIEPVDLVGVTITFATGFNAKFITKNKIGPGAEISITRSGDVIPFIKGVVSPAAIASTPDATIVGPYSWSAPNASGERVDFILDDIDSNDSVKLRRLKQFFDSMAIEFISSRGLEKLFAAGLITPESIIIADVKKIQSIVGDANGRKGMESLKKKLTNVRPWQLAGSHPAFGRGVGKRTLKKVFDTHGKILGLTIAELVAVEGVEANTAKKIKNSEKEYTAFLQAIGGHYTLDDAPEVKVTTGKLVGEYVVFTGIRDAALQADLEAAGAEVGNSKSKMTILIAKDPNAGTSKLKKAAEKGVKVIGINDARNLL